jgi:ethanolamine utilization protein EutA (predicted chaperonin)
MAAPRSSPQQSQKIHLLQTEVALLKQTASTLEHTVIAQNAAMKSELAAIHTVLREIHDKLDKTNLEHAIELVRQSEAQKALAATVAANAAESTSEIARIDSKISKASGALFTIFMAILGSAMAWISPGNKP